MSHAREQAVMLYLNGYTAREVADRLTCSEACIMNWLRNAGVPIRRPGPRGRRDVSTQAIVKLRDEGYGWYLIGKKVGMSHSAVRDRYLKHEQHLEVHRQRAHAHREDE